jgi:hypothetical protein
MPNEPTQRFIDLATVGEALRIMADAMKKMHDAGIDDSAFAKVREAVEAGAEEFKRIASDHA